MECASVLLESSIRVSALRKERLLVSAFRGEESLRELVAAMESKWLFAYWVVAMSVDGLVTQLVSALGGEGELSQ